jgi:hypothetical protein
MNRTRRLQLEGNIGVRLPGEQAIAMQVSLLRVVLCRIIQAVERTEAGISGSILSPRRASSRHSDQTSHVLCHRRCKDNSRKGHSQKVYIRIDM